MTGQEALAFFRSQEFYDDIGQKYGCINELCDVIEKELKTQENKQYLKWEDLEFKEKELVGQMKVKLGDNIYYIEWFKRNDYKTVNFYTNVDDNILSYTSYVSEEHKQFFNDLHLERIE